MEPPDELPDRPSSSRGLVDGVIRFCLENKVVVFSLLALALGGAVLVAPFEWDAGGLPRDPVPVDAIPDIGENQQIVFTEWEGRSPQDVEDQITYPLTAALLGIPEVRTVRSFSMFGFSSIYLIFNEGAEFYWTRSRILEKLNSLPEGLLPQGVAPALGPDATALGQVYWYTLEGRDREGQPAPGWDPQELRALQDFQVRYALQAVEGVAEVASIGGFVKEYQIDVDPDAMRAHGVTLEMVYDAVRGSNLDVGARTIEINRTEYVIRGVGFLRSLDDLRRTVVRVADNVPITLAQIAEVQFGPALRLGALDKEGAEAVGGVVVVRHGANPLEVIKRVKARIAELSLALPEKSLADGRVSKVTLVPFYDRTGLIRETLRTLQDALHEEILVMFVVVVLVMMHLRSSLLIAMMMPLAVLFTFIAMKVFGIDANIVALSGIAIAIGTIDDVGIVLTESIVRHLRGAPAGERPRETVFRASSEVGSAILTAVLTTIIGFLPVFFLVGAEGKLFRPLAFTKTFALAAAAVIALTLIPPVAHLLFTGRLPERGRLKAVYLGVAAVAAAVPSALGWLPVWVAPVVIAMIAFQAFRARFREGVAGRIGTGINYVVAGVIALLLAEQWAPLGPERSAANAVFVLGLLGGLFVGGEAFMRAYPICLRWCLAHKAVFVSVVATVVSGGALAWLGTATVFGFLPGWAKQNPVWATTCRVFPGLGEEFMPPLHEGSFLFMPSLMPHASIGEASSVLALQDQAIRAIPEVESVVGKLGRVESALDPAPVGMFETVVNYKPEYLSDEAGRILRFRYDRAAQEFVRDGAGKLVPDSGGRPYRQWRDHIRSPDDIWHEIAAAAEVPGSTGAPKLQPIETRLVMLQTGMRAALGLKVFGPDLDTIERLGLELERHLRDVPGIEPATVFADRIVGKPYLEIVIDRAAIARYGMQVNQVQEIIEVAVGGKRITTTVEGRERYPVRVRYPRELRDTIETLGGVLVPAAGGAQVPLRQVAEIRYARGPQMIKGEDTFLVGYVIFDKRPGFAEVDVVESAARLLLDRIDSGELVIPPGVRYRFTGTYENQVRAQKTLRVVIPVSLALIFLFIYLEFRRVSATLMVFAGVFTAWSGGFLMLWLYGQPWFLNFPVFDVSMRDLFQVHPVNLSVAVWVGFLALFGIATDDGVLMGTYLKQRFAQDRPATRSAVRDTTIAAARLRNRPAVTTTITTLLALLPVLTSDGRGAEVMVPMAIPTFGGMILSTIDVFLVPVLFCWREERRLRRG